MPTETGVTVIPLTVQTAAVAEVSATVNPLDEVGASVNEPALNLRSGIDAKVIVCANLANEMITTPAAPVPPAVRWLVPFPDP